MRLIKTLAATLAVAAAFPSGAIAQQYTVSCSGISGIRVDAGNQGVEVDKDAVIGATWVFRLTRGSNDVAMTLQNSRGAGGAKFQQRGEVVESTGQSVTIKSTNSGSVWFYTLYGGTPARILVTQHGTTSQLAGKIMSGLCQ